MVWLFVAGTFFISDAFRIIHAVKFTIATLWRVFDTGPAARLGVSATANALVTIAEFRGQPRWSQAKGRTGADLHVLRVMKASPWPLVRVHRIAAHDPP